MRRAIADLMTASALIPQFTVESSARASAVGARRAQLRDEGILVSAQDVLGKACVEALADHPYLNASFDGDAIVLHDEVHLGFAIAVEGGLMSPAVLAAGKRRLSEIAAERVRLRDGAGQGKLSGTELFGATFTISNLGPLGIERFTALVVPPQSAIVAVGTLAPGTADSAITLAVSCDHRVVDGAPAALFLRDVVERLESPDWLAALD